MRRHPTPLATVGAVVGLIAALQPISLVSATSVTCGTTVTDSITLDSDLSCTGDGLTAGASGITIDLNGHSITGPGSGVESTGIRLSSGIDNVTVKNGTIRAFVAGIRIGVGGQAESTGHLISHVTLAHNAVGVIALIFAFNNTFEWDRFVRNGTGLSINRFSGGQHITDSVIAHNGTGANFNDDSGGNVLERNLIFDNGVGASMNFECCTEFRHNFIVKNQVGIFAALDSNFFERQYTIEGNVFKANLVGVQFGRLESRRLPTQQAAGSRIENNRFIRNGAAGLVMAIGGRRGLEGAVISGNQFIRNGFAPGSLVDLSGQPMDDGANIFIAEGVPGPTVSNNTALRNADLGIEAVGVIDGGGNVAHGNGNPLQCVGVICRGAEEEESSGDNELEDVDMIGELE